MKRKVNKRDGTRFLALPFVVLEAPAFIALSGSARRLLLDVFMQYKGDNNGRLVACMSVLAERGWTSNDTLTRARRELENAGFLWQTRLGMRPNRAAWYAVTWMALDWHAQMDMSERAFPRGAYIVHAQEKARALDRMAVL